MGAAQSTVQLCRRYLHRADGKLRDSIGHQTGVVKGRVFLRHQQGFVNFAVAVNVAEVYAGEDVVVLFAAESYPSAVAGPAMP